VKVIVLCILAVLMIEPFVMYRMLVRQRDMRAEARTPPSELVASP
jgi:hypothetical protein